MNNQLDETPAPLSGIPLEEEVAEDLEAFEEVADMHLEGHR